VIIEFAVCRVNRARIEVTAQAYAAARMTSARCERYHARFEEDPGIAGIYMFTSVVS